ncbi:MAG: class I SAM-dependent methyltransferase [Acidobacteriota bacterium]
MATQVEFETPVARLETTAVESCPLCDGSRSTLFQRLKLTHEGIEKSFELRKCLSCELVFVNPRLSDATLAKLYDEEFYFSTGWPYGALASQVAEMIQAMRRRRVERHVRAGSLLDIGSGDGRFVHHMAHHGWQATGIDFSAAAQVFASRNGNGNGNGNGNRNGNGGRFLHGSLDDHDFPPGSLDLVTLWQVLEHIGEPRPLLRRCHEMLRSGGLLVASVPNIDGLSSRLAGERWWGLDVPRHLLHYAPRTLRGGLEQAGFRVMHVNHFSFQYDPYGLLHSSLDWVFTRRHFLSDFAKRNVPRDLPRVEYAYNLAALMVLGPMLAPLCVLATTTGSCLGRGGFIEVFARRE